MNWLSRLMAGSAPVDESRWVVLDVETSGLDARRDRLIAVAAIAVRPDWQSGRIRIAPGDSFEAVLRQPEPVVDANAERSNILLHGIGLQRQRDGIDPGRALGAFFDWAANSPLLAFHSAFDQAMIERHARLHLGQCPAKDWVDIEHLCAVTHEGVKARSLDDWMSHFGILCHERHQAAADTLAECELLLRIWPRVRSQCARWADVRRLAAQQRWIARA